MRRSRPRQKSKRSSSFCISTVSLVPDCFGITRCVQTNLPFEILPHRIPHVSIPYSPRFVLGFAMRSNAAGKDAGRSICLEDSCSAGSAEIETGGSGVGITAWLIIPKAPGLFSKASGSWLLVLLWPMMLSYEGAGSSACGRGSGRASGAVGNGGLAIGATGAASGAGARDGASQAAVPPEEGDTFTCFASAASGPAIGKRGFAGNGCGTSTAFAPAYDSSAMPG
mmetsp:Transcript_12915/g.47853  ORF Transcript_12915/g.47853 Transcript_12915/m.47853 type:complete len:225 (-) Transcript_12915:800-1474(-)